ncbi:MAG: type II toxin-antitoxin system VapC family toxin [bacterium]
MSTYLVDTTVLIDVQRHRLEAAQFLKDNDVVVSYVTSLEMLVGVKNKEDMSKTNKLLNGLVMHGGNTKISEKAVEFMRSYRLIMGIGIYDAILAATAIELKMILVTDNVKHFRGIGGLVVKKLAEVI